MSTANRRIVVQSQLQHATEALKARAQVLAGQKLDKKGTRRDPTYRKLQAVVKKITNRLAALDKVDAVNADLEKRRAERAAQPKQPKVKKVKAAPPAKAEGKKKERPAKAAT